MSVSPPGQSKTTWTHWVDPCRENFVSTVDRLLICRPAVETLSGLPVIAHHIPPVGHVIRGAAPAEFQRSLDREKCLIADV